ncbi:MAG TPA: DUF2934 domain-containing protein [Candidatus Angelobacter sp.]|nr:DUF2934 domain-containing protein [Candidatus Angelobacter sp.]
MTVKKRGSRGKKISYPGSMQTELPPTGLESSNEKHASMLTDEGLEEEIRRRAYELYEARGRAEGFDQEDWDRAKAEVLSRHRA